MRDALCELCVLSLCVFCGKGVDLACIMQNLEPQRTQRRAVKDAKGAQWGAALVFQVGFDPFLDAHAAFTLTSKRTPKVLSGSAS